MQKEIAVRLFQNAKYGTTYAKGVRHQALFNATADIKNPKVKYLLDFYTYEHWEFLAKEHQLDIINQVRNEVNKDSLVSWILRYDTESKSKTTVYGFSTLDMRTNELILCASYSSQPSSKLPSLSSDSALFHLACGLEGLSSNAASKSSRAD